jgi:hypothetical protein
MVVADLKVGLYGGQKADDRRLQIKNQQSRITNQES